MASSNSSGVVSFFFTMCFAAAAYFAVDAYKWRNRSFITVKGVAEQQVRADYGIFSFNVAVMGNSIAEIHRLKDNAIARIEQTLSEQYQLTNQELKMNNFRIENLQLYNPNNLKFTLRADIDFTIQSSRVEVIEKISQNLGMITFSDINTSINFWDWNKKYFITDLQPIKAQLLEKVSQSAQISADNLSKFNQVERDRLKRADQGVLQVLSANARSEENAMQSIEKVVRLVSTFEFYVR